ncbi:MAG TPA: glycoside hydrolase family 15 protein [Pyrinomonadaceae bacterium]|nr:glycoside hydrolase family 15 protein [Pyrinomonadaceae bacterium]
MLRVVVLSTVFSLACPALFALQTNNAPGAPGLDAHWPSAAKDGFGTSNTLASKVWFTLNNGVMTEVYYPRLDVPNVEELQLIVVGEQVETERDDTIHKLIVTDDRSLSFRQVNTARSGSYTITKSYATDPQRSTVLIHVNYQSRSPNNLFVYYDPSLDNSGLHDSAWGEDDALLAVDSDKASALVSSTGFGYSAESNGFVGVNDGLTQLKQNRKKSTFIPYERATDGNVAQLASIKGFQGRSGSFTLALGFGKTTAEALQNARASLVKGFDRCQREYVHSWDVYLKQLKSVEPKYQTQFNMAALVLKALEDKTYRGAMIASPSIPWGGGPNANEPTISGYHAIWARDLYHVATAFLALGDRASANRALDYLFRVQQKPDGSFPQNSWIDGRPIGGGLQLDEVALPIVLAWQLARTDRQTWLKHVKPAADFIVNKGPATGQDRWEEKPGYSPATIAAEVAGLVCAARIASLNYDHLTAAKYLDIADNWTANVEHWTATKGRQGEGHYYLRITENNNPDDGAKYEINSSNRVVDERLIVDAGFLELVRLGIKQPGDPLIVQSLALIDQMVKVETPKGAGWYRYNHDAYGEPANGGDYDGRTGTGRLWALLSGERGEYDVARGDLTSARKRLDAMTAFANEGRMIPEQVWDRRDSPRAELRFGEGTGSATPLAWSMAQFIRLAINIKKGRNIETPELTRARYVTAPQGN